MPQETTYDIKKIILFGAIILIIVALIGYFVFRKVAGPAGTEKNPGNLFPYDGSSVITPPSATSTEQGTTANPIVNNTITATTADRLRLIANYPVTNLISFLQNKTTTQTQTDPTTRQPYDVQTVTPTNYVRFNSKQNGFLVDAEVTKSIITINQKTDTLIPDAQEVWFASGGNAIAYRSWDADRRAILTFAGGLPTPDAIDYCQASFSTILTNKSKGAEVSEFQKYANAKTFAGLTVDGAFGAKAAAAIKPIQAALGIAETGTYDQALIDAMNADCTNINAARAQQTAGVQKVSGNFLTDGILRGTVSPDGTQYFYLQPTSDGGVVGIISDTAGKNQKQVFSSPLTEWKPQWVNDTTIAMTTLASSEADGYLYFLNPQTGAFTKVLGPISGLTTNVNASATTILYGSGDERSMTLSTYKPDTGVIQKLDITTLPEKCVWKNDSSIICAVPRSIAAGQYPDDWYQGNVQFSDDFWSIDMSDGTTNSIVSPSQSFDAYDLQVSPDANYFYFINKVDGSLWSYRLGDI